MKPLGKIKFRLTELSNNGGIGVIANFINGMLKICMTKIVGHFRNTPNPISLFDNKTKPHFIVAWY